MMQHLDDWDPYGQEDGDVARRLRAYAGERLSPDAWASVRMRAAVIESGRARQVAGSRHRFDVLAPFRIGLVRRAAPIALVAVLAIGSGTVAGVAASPGGPLYDSRLWLETALLPGSGVARFDAQVGHMDERIDELTSAVDSGNSAAADAAANAYDNQVSQAIQSAAQDRAELLDLRATLVKHLAHLQSLVKPNDKAAANLQNLIARTRAAIADVDRQLAALGPTSSP